MGWNKNQQTYKAQSYIEKQHFKDCMNSFILIKRNSINKKTRSKTAGFQKVVPPRIELGTHGFSDRCSTD